MSSCLPGRAGKCLPLRSPPPRYGFCVRLVCGRYFSSEAACAFGFIWPRLRRTKRREPINRFLFGGAVTLAAGIVAKQCGAEVGGLFLAFPALFPATITLIAAHEE